MVGVREHREGRVLKVEEIEIGIIATIGSDGLHLGEVVGDSMNSRVQGQQQEEAEPQAQNNRHLRLFTIKKTQQQTIRGGLGSAKSKMNRLTLQIGDLTEESRLAD